MRENFWWAGIHNCIAHPLMWMVRYAKWSCRFHDWTGMKAWPEGQDFTVTSDPNPGKLSGDLQYHGNTLPSKGSEFDGKPPNCS